MASIRRPAGAGPQGTGWVYFASTDALGAQLLVDVGPMNSVAARGDFSSCCAARLWHRAAASPLPSIASRASLSSRTVCVSKLIWL